VDEDEDRGDEDVDRDAPADGSTFIVFSVFGVYGMYGVFGGACGPDGAWCANEGSEPSFQGWGC
jgi:hypothetical protein